MGIYLQVSLDMFSLQILSRKKTKMALALCLDFQIYSNLGYISMKGAWCPYFPNKWPQLMHRSVLKHAYCVFSKLGHMCYTEHLQATYSRYFHSTRSGISDSLPVQECIYVSVRVILAGIASYGIPYSSNTPHLAEKRQKSFDYKRVLLGYCQYFGTWENTNLPCTLKQTKSNELPKCVPLKLIDILIRFTM